MNYKNKLLNTLINAIDEGEDGVDSNKISIKEAVYMSAEAWDEVKSSEIVEKVIELPEELVSWCSEETASNENEIELVGLAQQITVDKPINEEDVSECINAVWWSSGSDRWHDQGSSQCRGRNEESDISDNEDIEVEKNKSVTVKALKQSKRRWSLLSSNQGEQPQTFYYYVVCVELRPNSKRLQWSKRLLRNKQYISKFCLNKFYFYSTYLIFMFMFYVRYVY